jgi:hypothetical protein
MKPVRSDDGIARLASLPQLQSATGEELSPPLHFEDAPQSALLPSVLDKAFKGEL